MRGERERGGGGGGEERNRGTKDDVKIKLTTCPY